MPTDAIYMTSETVYCLLPELVLAGAATLIVLAGVFVAGRAIWSWIGVAAVLLAGWLLYGQYERYFWHGQNPLELAAEGQNAADVEAKRDIDANVRAAGEPGPSLVSNVAGPLAIDLFAQYVRWLVLVVGLALMLMSARPAADVQAPEYAGTLMFAIAGMMLVASARELVLLFLGLEMISIPTYVLLYLGRRDVESQEAAAKYFFLSIVSSAVMLYGFSFLYGAAGSTQLEIVRETLSGANSTGGAWFARLALVLIFAGLGFKLTAVPFHFYAPDVYQGTSNANAAVLSVLPKLGALVALVRIVVVAMPGLESYGWRIALVVALLTMTLGNVVALWQDNVRRMLAYSSIAHGGYMLIGLAVALAAGSGAKTARGFDGVGGVLFYVTVYALATTGALATLIYLGRGPRQIDTIEDLAGTAREHPGAGVAMAIFMFSLAGIPPLAGFWGKLNLFTGALSVHDAAGDGEGKLRQWFIALAVIGVLNAAISAAYYLRIVAVMFFRPAAEKVGRAEAGAGSALAMTLCAALVVISGVIPDPLQVGANSASRSVYVKAAGKPASKEIAASGNGESAITLTGSASEGLKRE
ncbi:MAG TPA: NADH-quinone oxidoreductase subunit N [Pirellulales bacterium]|jgi:NADH-quinone oxidoreductase subunit N